MERCYRIFGQVIKLTTIDSKEGEILHDELSLYPVVSSDKSDVEINYLENVEGGQTLSQNPKLNSLAEDGMLCKIGMAMVKFYFDEQKVTQIDFSIDQKPLFKRAFQKWKSMQFTTHREAIGQVMHELVLVPMAFIMQDYSVVHSSGVVNKQGKVVLFGGTGGVGKTSLEMTLCLEHDCAFFNDDIAVLNSDGKCYPNFSYPKIYGYNLEGNDEIKKEILGDLSVINKVQYAVRSRLRGKNKVRRRVQPDLFYGDVYNNAKPISGFVILFRSNVNDIQFEAISPEKAARLNSLIISAEYNVFFDHLRWHRYNAASLGMDSFISYRSVIEENTINLDKSLEAAEQVYLAHIPMDMTNDDYKVQMVEQLQNLGII